MRQLQTVFALALDDGHLIQSTVTSIPEQTGLANRIHVSKDTATLLIEAGKEDWVTKREQMVELKGKGLAQTFFVGVKNTLGNDHSTPSESPTDSLEDSLERLIDWNVEVLSGLLVQIVAHRDAQSVCQDVSEVEFALQQRDAGVTVLNEITQVVEMTSNVVPADAVAVSLDPEVRSQLKRFVRAISESYRDVPFHNFEHCSQ